MRDTWIGTCEWCGEPETTLTINDDLPDWTEGVACLNCEKSMLKELADQNEEKLDRLDSSDGWWD